MIFNPSECYQYYEFLNMPTKFIATSEELEKWSSNPLVNPRTGRKIKEYGRIYCQFASQYQYVHGYTKPAVPCRKKWIRMTSDEADGVGLPDTMSCFNCKKKSFLLYGLHDAEEGDSYCSRCGTDIVTVYYCVYCKMRGDNDQ